MSSNALHDSLLRPPILHILRAAGFNATRPAALDTLVDLASRYIVLLASQTASHAFSNHNDVVPTVIDVRMALQDVGALRPQLGIMEEQSRNEEDTRGMDAFLKWMTGDESREIRRIAGMVGSEGDVDVEVGGEREDFLTALKKKHSKTGEESRFQGTVLGKGADIKPIRLEGGHTESIEGWEAQLRDRKQVVKSQASRKSSSALLSSLGSPLTDA
ncbi:hypothetical protein MMC34_000056 [Xylographa carneopallida]|nr:hypothetical protein [Xylographa carneopallida]